MKLAIVGGGSTYTPELIDGLAREKALLPMAEIWLLDPDAKRLEILAEFSRRLLSAHGASTRVFTTSALSEAIHQADFVISQIRVGGQAARQKDTELGLRYNLVGQETTGCGGFACALRHIPASVEIARAMEKHAPKATLINFTNPAGIVTEALHRASPIKTIGICNVPWVMRRDIADYYKVPFESVELEYFGLNHLSWATKIKIRDEDKTGDVLRHASDIHAERYRFPQELIQSIEALPSPYLRYYYLTPDVIEELKQAQKTRAQEVMEIEGELLCQYSNPKLVEKPPQLMKRGGIYYGEVAVSAMKAMVGKTQSRQIVNLPNGKVFDWLPKEAVIEFPWKISQSGFVPDKTPVVSPSMKALMIEVKTYEELTIEAALKGDRKAAYLALLVNPLVGSASKAKKVLDEILEINSAYLPQFKATV